MKQDCSRWIDTYCENIEQDRQWFLSHPELGFKEQQTSEYLVKRLQNSCPHAKIQKGLALTGVKATLTCDNPQGIHVCLMCEMDAVSTPAHPLACAQTGAAHSCGHNVQMTVMLAAFEALYATSAYRNSFGSISFFAVPAEEYIELEYRLRLREEGKLRYLSGKQELLALGAFDDLDMILMLHAHPASKPGELFLQGKSLGFMAKTVRFLGKAAHAGASPEQGINALNAAMAAIMCIHMNRETFRDEDHVRVHPIITKGGDVVNCVPAESVMETYVRSANLSAMQNAAEKVDRSIRGACIAVGGKATVSNLPGYLPLCQNHDLSELFAQNARQTPGFTKAYTTVDMPGSTDIGDMSHIFPVIQPTLGGFDGDLHSAEFTQQKPGPVCIMAAKIMADTVIDLLANNAQKGRCILAAFQPLLTKQTYLQYLDDAFKTYSLE